MRLTNFYHKTAATFPPRSNSCQQVGCGGNIMHQKLLTSAEKAFNLAKTSQPRKVREYDGFNYLKVFQYLCRCKLDIPCNLSNKTTLKVTNLKSNKGGQEVSDKAVSLLKNHPRSEVCVNSAPGTPGTHQALQKTTHVQNCVLTLNTALVENTVHFHICECNPQLLTQTNPNTKTHSCISYVFLGT